MVDHGAEGFAIERLEVEVMHDAHGQRGVLLHAQMARQGRQSYQPQSEQIAAIKGEVQEGGEIDEEGIGEMLCLVQDRKSTRLNSSHVEISYAVFCLKKKI